MKTNYTSKARNGRLNALLGLRGAKEQAQAFAGIHSFPAATGRYRTGMFMSSRA